MQGFSERQEYPEEIRKTLDLYPGRCMVSYLFRRLHMEHGEQGLQLNATGGRFRSAGTHRHQISPEEFERLAEPV